jgi:hypothetical protein
MRPHIKHLLAVIVLISVGYVSLIIQTSAQNARMVMHLQLGVNAVQFDLSSRINDIL